MLEEKINKWLASDIFPQRVLFSGGEGLDVCLEVASNLQKCDVEIIKKGIHPDTLVFRDLGKSFKIDYSDTARKDGQSEQENAVNLIRWAYKKPQPGNKRVIILEGIERSSRSAMNALLKLLEEPPPSIIFLITTKNHHQLLDTILSRVTVVRLTNKTENKGTEEARDFMEERDILKRFHIISQLDSQSRDNKDKKINRTIFIEFLHACIEQIKKGSGSPRSLEMIWETEQAIRKNITPKLALERLALNV